MTDKQALSEVVRWALGYSDFPARREGEPAFYWRTHLRNKLNDFGYFISEDGTVSQLPGAEPLPLNADVEQAAKEYVRANGFPNFTTGGFEWELQDTRALQAYNAFIAGAGYGKGGEALVKQLREANPYDVSKGAPHRNLLRSGVWNECIDALQELLKQNQSK